MQQNTDESVQKIISHHGNDLSQRSASKIGLLLGLLIVVCAMVSAVHWPALSARAKFFDDFGYFNENVLVQNPSWTSARRFLTEVLKPSTVPGYYHPLSMLSLMADCALGGGPDNLRPVHRTSLALHVANTALVIVLLHLLFSQVWIAAAVGLLFGLHPMTVEPIPWVSERKTLLAAFFALWCLILYVSYARKRDWKLYAGCVVMYILALMSKPTSLPLPVLLLLIDYWPLRRLSKKTILEKLPLLAVGGVFAIIIYLSESRSVGVILPGQYNPGHVPLILCHNIIFYLYKIIWPVNLPSYYAYPESMGLSNPMVLAGVIGTSILIALLVISLRWTRAPLTSWLFFFIAIFPTMGVIGFTFVIAADKFAYLPSVGLLMALASLLGWFCGAGKPARRAVVAMTVLILAGSEAIATRRSLVHWRDTVSLYEHMLTTAPNAVMLHNNLGNVLRAQGKLDEAISHYRKALQVRPDYAKVHYNLGIALKAQGKVDEAISCYRKALQFKPDSADAHNNLGIALKHKGKVDEAISHYRKALQSKPDFADAYNNLGNALQSQGKLDEAISHYRKALQVEPGHAKAHGNLGNALAAQGKLDESISHYRKALQSEPDLVAVHYNLGIALAMTGRANEALKHFRKTVRLKPNWPAPLNWIARILITHPDPKLRNAVVAIELAERAAKLTGYKDASILDTLSAAYAEADQFDQAIRTAQIALDLASAAKDNELANNIRRQLELYEQAKP